MAPGRIRHESEPVGGLAMHRPDEPVAPMAQPGMTGGAGGESRGARGGRRSEVGGFWCVTLLTFPRRIPRRTAINTWLSR